MGLTSFFYAAAGSPTTVEKALRAVWPDTIGLLGSEERPAGSVVDAIYRNDDGVDLVLWQDGEFTGFAESTLNLPRAVPRTLEPAYWNGPRCVHR